MALAPVPMLTLMPVVGLVPVLVPVLAPRLVLALVLALALAVAVAGPSPVCRRLNLARGRLACRSGGSGSCCA